MSKLPRLIVVLGPTASGKSALGLAVAERFGGEILVCDSTQVYRHFDIGTAKVPPAEQRGIPHHLVDLVEPHEVFTAGQYRERATDVLESMRRRNKLPIVTAGTGLYLRALLEGLSEAPTRSEELRKRLRERAQRRGPDSLHRLLKRLDPEAAGRIAPRDTQKIIRAIEMRILAGKPVAEIHRSGKSPLQGYDVYKVGLQPPREQLYARIDARVKEMIALGWVDEVRRLIDQGIPADAKPFQFIGYAELREHSESGQNPEKVIPAIQQATRRFAKRQMTWFRKEPKVHWLSGFGDYPAVVREAIDILERQGDFS
ncbi:MAG TPA: tRNA (adenosine(37)-N6)-dimethylallyltransferase MiaA [Candidatus Bathyarchaeia archaeon]|nr:tRNA (adenosine(37)-N6)-dimethylallyltransferase MiaA [Candidatus Bathyarchaeia archaeon]